MHVVCDMYVVCSGGEREEEKGESKRALCMSMLLLF
jgi:hypothetical protein